MKSRPVNLDLTTIRFPITAIVSILHRISGVVLFIASPIFLYALSYSLKSAEQFATIKQCFAATSIKVLTLLFFVALTYHIYAGLRHLLMDFGWGETIEAGRKSAVLMLVLTIITVIGLGVWLW